MSYLHLMPLLKPRPGENDGGYAVMDYRAVDPRVGTMDDLEAAARALRERGMSLCVDLVLNHTAREHPWAKAWLAGDPEYADFYFAFPDRTMPDAYEATISDVFPDRAPGSFTWVGTARGGRGAWVWTTFFGYQWDLNYANPNVFAAVLDTVLWLANRGIEIFRMDAVPFMWKRLGTSCKNQPEVHDLMQALHALAKLAAPATIFKAEAIVSPEDLVPYLGGHARYRPECELAYHNQLMVMLWSEPGHEGRAAGRAVAAPDGDDPGRHRLGHLRARPRRHRLGGQRHRRLGRRLEPVRPPAVPQRLLLRHLPESHRPRRAVPGQPRDRRRPHLRVVRRAVRDRARRGSAATTPRWRRASAGTCCCTP